MNQFINVAMNENNINYKNAIKRNKTIYNRKDEMRDDFTRDYTRVIFSQGYRRLKNKTQVFFSPNNDHICTRGEHVTLVESISSTISKRLGLNENLTKAIATGHDLGHGPFGHGGEKILSELQKEHNFNKFYHEMNSLFFIDYIETLHDDEHKNINLNLTYAVRDGIVCHCGEELKQSIIKREEYFDLNDYKHPGQFEPYTWEGCVVKISDKIAYLTRDIEDGLILNIINKESVEDLLKLINQVDHSIQFNALNNSVIVNYFIQDICKNSTIEKGISLSDTAFTIMKLIMQYNYKNIYLIDRVKIHHDYVTLMIHSIFNQLNSYYDSNKNNLILNLSKDLTIYPKLITTFNDWLIKYSDVDLNVKSTMYNNDIIFILENSEQYKSAILSYIAGMTDRFIIELFNELINL